MEHLRAVPQCLPYFAWNQGTCSVSKTFKVLASPKEGLQALSSLHLLESELPVIPST